VFRPESSSPRIFFKTGYPGSIIGIFGMSMGILLLLFHLASVETFGVPYLSPFTSSEGRDLEDNII